MKSAFMFSLVAPVIVLLMACQPSTPPTAPDLVSKEKAEAESLHPTVWPVSVKRRVESVALLSQPLEKGPDRIVASLSDGLQLLDTDGNAYAQLPGRMTSLDLRTLDSQTIVLASFDRQRLQPLVVLASPTTQQFYAPLLLPTPAFGVEDLCFYRDTQNNLFLFLVGEEGRGEQWLVGAGINLLTEAKHVRDLSLPPTATFCAVDDQQSDLFVNEEEVGVWRYPAAAETDPIRLPIDLLQPFGRLHSAADIAVVPGGLFILDGEQQSLHAYQRQETQWLPFSSWKLNGLAEPEQLSVQMFGERVALMISDDRDEQFYQAQLTWTHQPKLIDPVITILPQQQTDLVVAEGDAADDPAIWVHPSDTSKSLVIGTDKKYGLLVYDLQGKEVQRLASGDLNNVDLRKGFRLGEQTIDIAVGTKRNDNSLAVFAIDPKTGRLRDLGTLPTPLKDIYGICLYSPVAGEIHVLPNDKNGRVLQYRLHGDDGELKAELLREFNVASQPEGCVADDQNHRLFIGEEKHGVWTLSANPAQPGKPEPVMSVGEQLKADVEGIGLYQGKSKSYLVISSQGDDSYVVLEAEAPFRFRGKFQVGMNALAGIDGVSETDGLEVSSVDFGGAYSDGLLVLQDGRKRLPQGKQNFKYVSWQAVRMALNLE